MSAEAAPIAGELEAASSGKVHTRSYLQRIGTPDDGLRYICAGADSSP